MSYRTGEKDVRMNLERQVHTMSKNYKFETLQLHVGQENADPATDSRAVPI